MLVERRSQSMEWKYLLKPDARIRLWSNTIILFYKTRRFEGPFKSAGYTIGVIEPDLDPTQIGGEPDIVSSSGRNWAIVEVTLNDQSKECQLDAYKDLNPRVLQQWLGNIITGKPNVICSRLVLNRG